MALLSSQFRGMFVARLFVTVDSSCRWLLAALAIVSLITAPTLRRFVTGGAGRRSHGWHRLDATGHCTPPARLGILVSASGCWCAGTLSRLIGGEHTMASKNKHTMLPVKKSEVVD